MLSQNATISLLCPTRGRASQAMRLALSVLQTVSQADRVELLFYVDSNDPERANYAQAFQQHKLQLDRFRRCSLMIGEPIGISKAWNELAARSQGDLLVMAADDQTYNTPGWDDRLLTEIQPFPDEVFCAWFNDGHWGEKLCTFPIVSRRWCLTLGYFTTGLFECLYDDLWIMDLAQRLDRLHYIPDVLTEHLHWSYGKSDIDATYAWKQVDTAGQLKPAVRRDMNLFSRTAPYRETDARRLMQMMNRPPQTLKPGLGLMGQTSIFSDSSSDSRVQRSEETAPSSEAIESAAQPLQPPTIVNLHLQNQAGKSYKLLLQPQVSQQQEMLTAFQKGQYYQPEVSQLLMQVLQPGDCCVDAEAEVGYFALLAAMIVGDRGKVLALEAQASSYRQLVETIRLNGLSNVQTVQAAVDAAPLLDRLLAIEPLPKLLKLKANPQTVALLINHCEILRDRPVPYLLCQIETPAPDWQNFGGQMAAIGYDTYCLEANALRPLPPTGDLLKGGYLVLVRQPVSMPSVSMP